MAIYVSKYNKRVMPQDIGKVIVTFPTDTYLYLKVAIIERMQIGRHGMIIINEGKYDCHP
ncbi:hypothetical protein AB733_00840 [Photobacterium swingsii]|uniref:Uncharacterized protein n=1 Tax=Photobacterium swingsii TaxID=680026 RepID=A0A0J8VFB6_9GAMM|nr:hypothetical protein AB733_00840 [Photobacterium swingsii]PSW26918.1 hypothetical protein C9I94_02745 [Photobacterium swingsii]